MNDTSPPSDIARETLRRLAARRLPPTPDNFRALYHEIAGTPAGEVFPERTLKALVSRLPRTSPVQVRFVRQIEDAVSAHNWSAICTAIDSILVIKDPPAWSALIRELLGQIERRQVGITTARKREGLEHILSASSGDAEQLFARLTSLIRSWSQAATAATSLPAAEAAQGAAADTASAHDAPFNTSDSALQPAAADAGLDPEARNLIGDLLESSVALLLVDNPELANEATALSAQLRSAADRAAMRGFIDRMKVFVTRLQWTAGDQAELKTALMNVLQLIVDNIAELVADDQWLHGQIAMVSEAFASPLELRRLDDVEHRLKDVIYKQTALKRGLNDAKERLKAMLASFVDHLAHMSESTTDYHDRIERCAVRIGTAKDISELTDVIEEVMRETHSIQITTGRTRDELRVMKDRVEESEKEIFRLQGELAHTSKMVRHDQLTGALNRKGLDEALQREFARAGRRAAPMCIALLDVDNFKALNDSYGHRAGDDALIHLTRVIRETLRPHDTLARYGGEEFIVLLPETALDDAAGVVARLQRELTKRFFLHNNERILITFSAGVTQVVAGEDRSAALARADAAMYDAKRAGKNRVIAAA